MLRLSSVRSQSEVFAIAKTFDNRLVKWWQKILGIQDWRVDVTCMDNAKCVEVYGPGKAGYCEAVQSRQWASVMVNLDPGDGTDPEHSLVHEEVHVLLNDVWMAVLRMMDSYITDAHAHEFAKAEVDAKMEIAVDKMASALMRLKAKTKTGVRG